MIPTITQFVKIDVCHKLAGLIYSTLESLAGCFQRFSVYTGCPRRKGLNFGRVFLRSNYTDITQNNYIQSSMVTEILNIEK